MAIHLELPPSFGGFHPPLHALFEAAAYFLGYQWHRRERRRHGDVLRRGQRLAIIAAAAVGAWLGSKLPGIWTAWAAGMPDTQGPLPGWLGGKTVAGGILFAWFSVEAAKKFLGIRVSTGDAFVFPLCLAMSIGRLGCFLAGLPDGTQGLPASVPWAVDYGDGIPRHPSPVYEILFLGALAAGLRIFRNRLAPGARFKIFLVAYLQFRVAGDFLKPDYRVAYGLTSIQWFCLAGLVPAFWHFFRNGNIPLRERVQSGGHLRVKEIEEKEA